MKSGASLIRYDAMVAAITAAYKVDEVKTIRDKMVAMTVYMRQAKNRDAEILAQKIRIRAERKAGQLLREMEKHKGGKPNRSHNSTGLNEPATLAKLRISKDQSSEWQKLAEIPDRIFEQALTEEGQLYALSGRAVVRAARRNLRDQKERNDPPPAQSPLWPQLENGPVIINMQEEKWSVEEACYSAFRKSKIGKKVAARIREVMPSPMETKLLACDKASMMTSVLTAWFDANWTKLPVPDQAELAKAFKAEKREKV